ncbi:MULTISPECIES: hypothetical protein [Sphingomonas]|jgi:hypothetical protein|uniref:Uncharacterized protein n=1 Tax=Sphingomonas abaci TaxID=237611 RepID=A0A7W7AKQ7_9SPHN|nr:MULTISPECIES: hypothetical protein [Sphingomonas]MBB4618835.1 hypothetical protein [Sphingomonas abaci]MDR6126046.1 hypothetical protein [Sphingomonas sp. SORGH_AS_0438]MDR6136565.1 hypothetical protein [Sphingomonas sp. SORGH_AS_0802]
MSRLLVSLLVILVVVGGGMMLLAGRAKDRPTTQIEQQVSLANLQ